MNIDIHTHLFPRAFIDAIGKYGARHGMAVTSDTQGLAERLAHFEVVVVGRFDQFHFLVRSLTVSDRSGTQINSIDGQQARQRMLLDSIVFAPDEKFLSLPRSIGCRSSRFTRTLQSEGADLRKTPLEQRKLLLAKLLKKDRPGIQFNGHIEDMDGAKLYDAACKMGLEGIVAKRRDLPYRSGRCKTWIKVKNPRAPAAMRVIDGTF
jgi:ATP dependent DNA ligase-like protein